MAMADFPPPLPTFKPEAAAETRPSLSVTVVTFLAGGYRFGVEARHVHSQETQVANTYADICAAETVLGLPTQPGFIEELRQQRRPVLRIGGIALAISPPVELRCYTTEMIHPLPPLLIANCRVLGLIALAFDELGLVLLINGESLGDPNRHTPNIFRSRPVRVGQG
ncbi:hypothetical protein WCLP8_2640011 [uncultured Gammaproteobacteria bacterium]